MIRSACMPTDHIIALLIAERDRLTLAIEALQGPTRRRGRPPKNSMAVSPNGSELPASKKHTRTFTAAQRKAQAKRMKAYWAKKKKATATVKKSA
jgi:hypothetical protein